MIKSIGQLLIMLIATCCSMHVAAQSRVPPITTEGGYSKGVATSFAGVSNGKLIVAGGANFAQKPVTEGGSKIFYDDIFALVDGTHWSRKGSLDKPMAHGAAIQMGDSIIFVGGVNSTGRHSDVTLVSYENSALKIGKLPHLPIALEQHGGAAIGRKLYVVGGQTADSVSSALYMLDLSEQNPEWVKLSNVPFAVMQPVVVGELGGLYVWGGFTPSSSDRIGIVYDYGYKYSPQNDSWSCITGIPSETMVGAAGVSLGGGKIACIGGVNKEIFEQALIRRYRISKNDADSEKLKQEDAAYMLHPVPWYKFNRNLYVYDTATDSWNVAISSDSLAKAGAAVVVCGDDIFVINGECKPGIRSADVWRVQLHDINK